MGFGLGAKVRVRARVRALVRARVRALAEVIAEDVGCARAAASQEPRVIQSLLRGGPHLLVRVRVRVRVGLNLAP